MKPPPRTEELLDTYILEWAVWQLSVPLVFNLCNLPRDLVIVNKDLTVNGLLFPNALDDIAGAQGQTNWVPAVCDFVVEAFDFREDGG